jgi:hypothetical protein
MVPLLRDFHILVGTVIKHMEEEISTFRGVAAKLLYDVCGPTARYFGEESLLLAKAGAA